jgi:hypothetical protein
VSGLALQSVLLLYLRIVQKNVLVGVAVLLDTPGQLCRVQFLVDLDGQALVGGVRVLRVQGRIAVRTL